MSALERFAGRNQGKAINLRDNSVASMLGGKSSEPAPVEEVIHQAVQEEKLAFPKLQELSRLTVQLDKDIHEALANACSGRSNPTRETWIEAAWLWLQQNPEAYEAVMASAKQLHQERLRQK